MSAYYSRTELGRAGRGEAGHGRAWHGVAGLGKARLGFHKDENGFGVKGTTND